MQSSDVLQLLTAMGQSPWMLAVAIILMTFVLEDAATVGAALLAASGALPDAIALSALYAGIFLGDLGLYGLGRAARAHSGIRGWIGDERIAKGRQWLDRRLTGALVGARFVPGLRLPTYTASGFVGVSFVHFALVAAVAGFVWTTCIFYLVKSVGEPVLALLGPWKYLAGAAILALVIALPVLVDWWRAMAAAKRP